MAIIPAAISHIIMGTVNGLTLLGPFRCRFNVDCSNTSMPPMPDPISTPYRVGFFDISKFECFIASFAAKIPIEMNREFLFSSFLCSLFISLFSFGYSSFLIIFSVFFSFLFIPIVFFALSVAYFLVL